MNIAPDSQPDQLTSVAISGYKGLGPGTRIELSSLSLVFGENSAGKSSLVRLLVSIAKAILAGSRYPLIPVVLGNEGAGFRDLLTQGQGTITLALTFSDTTHARFECSYQIAYIPETNAAAVIELALRDVVKDQAWEWRLDLRDGTPASTYQLVGGASVAQLTFAGLAPRIVNLQGDPSNGFAECIDRAREALFAFAESVRWIGPLRTIPPKHIPLTTYPETVGHEGTEVPQLLHEANPEGSQVARLVSDWYVAATGRALSVVPAVVNNKQVFDLALTTAMGAVDSVSIAEHGAGMAQAFPVVGLCSWATAHSSKRASTLLIFENPELHLHDAIHEHLASLFLRTIDSGVRVVAETHSENLLLATQLAVIQEPGRASTVSVNWVRRDESALATSSTFRFDEEGSLGSLWSKSIFGYTAELARKIITARMKSAGGANGQRQ